MDNCPKCGVSFIGEPIPEHLRQHCGGTHWRLEIAIDGGYAGIYDGIVAIMCYACSHTFPRSNHPIDLELFEKYKNYVA